MIRNIIYTVGLGAVVSLAFSCTKPVDIEPIGLQTKDSVLNTEADYRALLNSAYTVLAADNYYGGGYQIMNDLLADHLEQAELTGDWLKIYNRNSDIFTGTSTGFYAQPYFAIFRANTILENLAKLSGSSKDNFEGQAKFIRGLGHFDLVRLYGQPYVRGGANTQDGVVLRTSTKVEVSPRATVAASYNQIIADLKAAETLLPDVNGVYPTKWAAKAILARVYFQMNDFANAYDYANQVIQSGKFTFDADYSKRYSAGGTPEAIFNLIYETNNTGGRFNTIRTYRYVAPQLPALRTTASLYNSVNSRPTDARKAWFQRVSVNGQDWYVTTKYDALVFQMPVVHLTEMKLIRAESAAELNQNLAVGIADINDIIRRAYGPASGFELPATISAQFLLNTVRREREIEMAFEGDRLQQLKRRGGKGEQITIRNAPWNCPGLVLVLPPSEVTQNPGLQQNPQGGCQ